MPKAIARLGNKANTGANTGASLDRHSVNPNHQMPSISNMKNSKNWLPAVLFFLVTLGMLMPLLIAHFEVLNSRAHYQPYPIYFLAIAVIFILRYRRAEPAHDQPKNWVVYLTMSMSLLVMPVAYLYYSSWVAAFSSVVLLGWLGLKISKYKKIENLFGIWCMFLLFVRPPNQIEGRLLRTLQGLSSQTASVVLDFLGVSHNVQGDTLALLNGEVSLKALCIGPVSLVSTLAITAILLVIYNRPLLHSVLLLISALVVAWFLNAMRVLFVGYAFAKWEVDFMSGGAYAVMIMVSLLLSVIMVICGDIILKVFLATILTERSSRDIVIGKLGKRCVKLWDWIVSFGIGPYLSRWRIEEITPSKGFARIAGIGVVSLFLSVVLAMAITIIYHRGDNYQVDIMHDKKNLVRLTQEDVLAVRPGWTVVAYEEEDREFSSVWGTFSKTWRLKYDDLVCVISFDYPFDKWHDVKACYTKIGWQIRDEEIIRDSKEFRWGVSQTGMKTPTGDFGYILCSHMNHLGEWVQPKPTTHDISMFTYYLHPKRWSAPFGVSVDKNKNTFYQIQMMIVTTNELDEETRKEVRLTYADFREQCRRIVEAHAKRK